MRRSAAVVVVVVAIASLLVTACTGDGGDGNQVAAGRRDAAPGSEADLHATLQPSRLFATRRALRLAVRNVGDRDVRIGQIQLRSPLFEQVPPEARDAVVRAGGRTVAMPLPLGEADCDRDVDGPAELLTDADGGELLLPLDEAPAGVLADLHAAECAVADVRADIEVRLGDDWERTAPRTIEGTLEVTQRHAGVAAVVDDLLGNVIFTVRAGASGDVPAAFPLEVDDDRRSTEVPVAITASRCDPHALIEYKRTFIFVSLVRVGDAEPVRLDVEAEGGAQRALEDLLAACLA